MNMMNIGEAATISGVSAKMIRHYEEIGLIHASRSGNGYRTYGEHDLAVLRFIRNARELGFPLAEIGTLLELWRNRGRNSAEVKKLAMSHVEQLEEKARALSAMADSLKHLASHCAGDARPECPILETLAS